MLLACMQRHTQCFHTSRGISPGSSDRSILQSNGPVDIVADYHNVNFLRSPNQACSHFMWGRSETRYYMRTTSQFKLVSPPPPFFFFLRASRYSRFINVGSGSSTLTTTKSQIPRPKRSRQSNASNNFRWPFVAICSIFNPAGPVLAHWQQERLLVR